MVWVDLSIFCLPRALPQVGDLIEREICPVTDARDMCTRDYNARDICPVTDVRDICPVTDASDICSVSDVGEICPVTDGRDICLLWSKHKWQLRSLCNYLLYYLC